MSDITIFWAKLPKRKVRHLIREEDKHIRTACGLVAPDGLGAEIEGDQCKNCLRAIAK